MSSTTVSAWAGWLGKNAAPRVSGELDLMARRVARRLGVRPDDVARAALHLVLARYRRETTGGTFADLLAVADQPAADDGTELPSADRLAGHLRRVLTAVTEQPDIPLSRIDLVTEAEHRLL